MRILSSIVAALCGAGLGALIFAQPAPPTNLRITQPVAFYKTETLPAGCDKQMSAPVWLDTAPLHDKILVWMCVR